MDTRTLAATLLKVAGLVIALHALMNLPSYFPLGTPGGPPPSPSLAIAGAALNVLPPFLLGLALWFFPGRVSNKIITPPVEGEATTVASIERVAVTVLGLYFLTWGLADLARQLAILAQLEENRKIIVPGALSAAIQIAIGLVFAFGARRIITLLRGPRDG